ncbi:MAG: hypothetical protein PVS3B3_08050 [Ktedonobacteraceae bacterium]
MPEVELERIGPYIISDLVSKSSTSSFYLSKYGKKDVTIKRIDIPLSSPEVKEAFLKRAAQLKKLKHRSILETQKFDIDGDFGYLVLERREGETLRQYFTSNKLHVPADIRPILSPVADALHYAHVQNTLHANLHPGSVSVDGRKNPFITEFSLSAPAMTLDDEAFAIPYMAPEHLQGLPIAASDQYALAVMVYEWLCGRRPFEATERELLLEQQEKTTFPTPRSINTAISPLVERVLTQALAYKPEERFPTVQAFADAYLKALLGVAVTPNPKARPISPIAHKIVIPPAPVANEDATAVGAQCIAPIEPIQHHDISTSSKKHNGTKLVGARLIAPTEPPIDGDIVPTEAPSIARAEPKKPVLPINNSRLQSIVSADLCQGGVLSQQLPGYEERPAQVEMAMVVARALNENVPALVEASTGTGKSLAYLVPAVRSGKVAIISTANKALQEQLFYKDIPFVQKHIQDFGAALVKGVGNYVCIDRLENERTGIQYYAKNTDFKRLVDITNDPDSDFMGDFETLGFQLPNDIRSKVATDSDQCAWSKCGYFSDCYVRQMREQAALAQVIVVNHTLLLLDAAIGGFLLPERDVIILDEAHHLEEEATRSFTITIGPTQIQTLLNQRTLRNHSQLSLQHDAMEQSTHTWERLAQVANPGFKGRVNLEAPLEEGLKLATVISDLADSLRKQRPKDLPEKEGQLYDKLLKRTQNLGENIRTVFSVAQPTKFVYYVERIQTSGPRGGIQLQVSAAPLDVTGWLQEKLFKKCNVICTSATLATIGPNPMHPEEKGPNFGYFRKRVGLEQTDEPDEVLERILPLSFDYESNALLYMPRDLPEPTYGAGSDDYMKAIAREMYKLVKASHGRAFLLFSSKRMLERAYELMEPHLPYPLLKQGDMTRLELTRRFREEEGSVLFGLKSFWEGVDIAGDALSLVVIDKLPFDPPDDPVHEARVAQMKAAGENWFGTYVLPQAVLRLKQGLGRLLRSREDRGVMAILDTRLHTKGYGKMVLNALPPARRTSSIRDVEHFFAEGYED